MTIKDMRIIAKYHFDEADKCTVAAKRFSIDGHHELAMRTRNQEHFHQDTAAKLEQLAAAFETITGLTAKS